MQDDMPTWSPYNYGFCNPVIFNDPSGNTPQGGWYTDDKGKYHFVDGMNSKEMFDKSEYKDKGTWQGENVNAESADLKYHLFYSMDGSRTITNNETGEKKHISFEGKEKIVEKGKSNNIVAEAPKESKEPTKEDHPITPTGAVGGTGVGLTLDFITRDRVDYRNTFYNPKVRAAKELWKAGKMSDAAYSSYRYHAQKATKMMYKSSISKLIGELPPTGKPLWQQKALAEDIGSGLRKISSGAGKTRALTSFVASAKFMPYLRGGLVGLNLGLSVYTVATSNNKPRALVSETTGWAGAWAGASSFATFGAAIGGPFAPITGGLFGIIGAGIGYYYGNKLGGSIFNYFSK